MIFLGLFLLNQADSLGSLALLLDWYAILSIWLDLFAGDWSVVPSFHDVIASRLDLVPVADNIEFILDSIGYFLLSGLVETTEGFFDLPWILRIIKISTYDFGLWLVLQLLIVLFFFCPWLAQFRPTLCYIDLSNGFGLFSILFWLLWLYLLYFKTVAILLRISRLALRGLGRIFQSLLILFCVNFWVKLNKWSQRVVNINLTRGLFPKYLLSFCFILFRFSLFSGNIGILRGSLSWVQESIG